MARWKNNLNKNGPLEEYPEQKWPAGRISLTKWPAGRISLTKMARWKNILNKNGPLEEYP